MTNDGSDTSLVDLLTIAPAELRLHLRHVPVPGRHPWDPIRTSTDGRWASSATLYTALEAETCLAEYCRWRATEIDNADPTGSVGIDPNNLWSLARLEVPDPLLPRCIVEVNARFHRMIDVRREDNLAALAAFGLDRDALVSDNYAACSRTSAMLEAGGIEAILSPSAAWPYDEAHCVSVLPAGLSRILGSPKIRHEAVRPTVLIAYGTRYKTGERPRWLGAAA